MLEEIMEYTGDKKKPTIIDIGTAGDLNVYIVKDDEGVIPHFHVRDAKDGRKFRSTILLAKPWYMIHSFRTDLLNSDQKLALSIFMESESSLSEKYGMKNNWELACFMWDTYNLLYHVPSEIEEPDYMDLLPFPGMV